jgi:hypothetical protein
VGDDDDNVDGDGCNDDVVVGKTGNKGPCPTDVVGERVGTDSTAHCVIPFSKMQLQSEEHVTLQNVEEVLLDKHPLTSK